MGAAFEPDGDSVMDDNELLSLCAWKEARGEGDDGMRAVMHVILNRVGKPGFSKTIQEVIMSPNQFTSMSVPSDPEYDLWPAPGDPQFAYCMDIAPNIANDPDLTNGALYYANLEDVTSGWFYRNIIQSTAHPQVATVGRQTFFA